MPSRRSFLQWSSLGLGLSRLQAQSEAERPFRRAYWEDWPAYLTQQMKEARDRRVALLRNITSPAQAEERIAFIRKQVWDLIGGPFGADPPKRAANRHSDQAGIPD